MKKRKQTIDELDVRLLNILSGNPTQSYAKIKDTLGVSIGTLYLRVNRLKELGIIKGARLVLDPQKLGYSFSVMIWLQVPDTAAAVKVLESYPAVSAVYVLTGELNVLAHAYLGSVNDLHQLLQSLQQALKAEKMEVQIVLEEPIQRGVPLPTIASGTSKSRNGKAASEGKAPSKAAAARQKKKA
ncbi:MAG: winged helix-turn-helix transcriptional regulator [Bacteroidia bacterium]|nr:winged helix-turn-helix transcriptional regulator [Bacteroidia bacterium]MCX7764771.1 winged helix-turn-helix transcriptional regulator [Bacteroidia bacterium]MDW8057623.1 winged helix-turn-helix transcriptional regulator [Bacteroidia bacterium]